MSARIGRRWLWTNAAEKAADADVLDRLGIGDLAHRHIRELSGGQQQRVFIARALLSDLELLLMDEPTSDVDVRTRHEMLHLLSDLHGTPRKESASPNAGSDGSLGAADRRPCR